MIPLEMFANRYHVLRRVGAGGMGVVYLVEDSERANQLMALKTLNSTGDEEAGQRFRDEFRHVHGVAHPHIPKMFDYGILRDQTGTLYFTSEFVDGKPLDSLLPQWSSQQLHVILVSLCRALSFLHSRGLLHRDIKPENVLGRLDADGHFATIKLVDFGLAASRLGSNSQRVPAENSSASVSGTIEYLAPELIENGLSSVATDIYALGMLMYRLATGKLPFDAQDPLALAKQRTTTEAPPPLRFRPDLPVGLSDVISALIRRRPEERPLSARHVIALLNEREGTEFPYESPETRNAYIRSAAGVTNPHARQRLRELMQLLLRGESPPNVMILGMPGLGSTRLLSDFATDLSLENLPVAVIREPNDLAGIASTGRVVIVTNSESFPEKELAACISHTRNIWWVVAAESKIEAVASALANVEFLNLTPLDVKGVQDFISATFPENNLSPQFTEKVFDQTLGLPGAIQNLFDYLLERDTLRIGLSGWELLPGNWEVPLHADTASYVARQFTTMSSPVVWLTTVLSCSASPVPAEVLNNLASVENRSPDLVRQAAQTLARARWIEESSERFGLALSAVGRCVRNQIEVAERRKIHRYLFAAWKRENVSSLPEQTRELIYHDFHAADWQIVSDDAEAILKQVISQGNIAWARAVIEAGLANDPPPELRKVMLCELGNIEYIESNLLEAANRYAQVLENGSVERSHDNLIHFSRYGMILEKLGQTERAEEILQSCLPVLDTGNDANAGAIYGSLAWIAFKRGDAEKAQQLAEEGLVRVPPKTSDNGLALLLNTLATLAFYKGDSDAAVMAWKRCLEVNEAIHDRKGIANMYNNLGVVAAQSGDRLKARSLWEKCAEIANEIQDMHRLAGIYNNLGIDSLETGALPQAEEYYVKALTMFRRMKSPRDQVEILSNLGELSYYRADYARAHSYWQEALNLAETLDDRECQVEPLVYMGKLLSTLEDLEKAETTLSKARDLAHELAVKKGEGQAWEGLAALHSRKGNEGKSAEALRNAHLVLTEDVDPLACLHLHLTECSIAAEHGNAAAVKDALAEARKVADIKWDPFAAARTQVYGLLFAQEEVDQKERARQLWQLSVYPDFLWKYHWASARKLTAEGALRKALEEYGRGVSVLKAISSRLSDDHRAQYLSAPHISRFKAEALELRRSLSEN